MTKLFLDFYFCETFPLLSQSLEFFAITELQMNLSTRKIKFTVKPLLSGPPIKRTPSIKRTLRRVPKLTSYISFCNEPLFRGHLY